MAAPIAVAGDQIVGQCVGHMIIGPLGVPAPAPPMPFGAPLSVGLAATVLVGGKPAAVVGASGLNATVHAGLHGTDPFLAPPAQRGEVLTGSSTVFIEGKPAATGDSMCKMCLAPAQRLIATGVTVLVN